jgi:toxin CptA
MHNAPSVSYPVGRSRFALAFIAVAWLAGAAGLLAWALQVAPTPLQVLVATAAMLVPGAVAMLGWLHSAKGVIAWNGEGWTWSGAEPGTPEAVLDLQRVMLLRWSAAPRTRWFWLERSSHPALWDDLRRAVYSRAPNP